MTVAVAVLGAVVVAQWVAIGFLLRHHLRTLDRQVAERDTWGRERWEYATRIQAPAAATLIPPPSPTGLGPAERPPVDDDEPVDESELVGTIA